MLCLPSLETSMVLNLILDVGLFECVVWVFELVFLFVVYVFCIACHFVTLEVCLFVLSVFHF